MELVDHKLLPEQCVDQRGFSGAHGGHNVDREVAGLSILKRFDHVGLFQLLKRPVLNVHEDLLDCRLLVLNLLRLDKVALELEAVLPCLGDDGLKILVIQDRPLEGKVKALGVALLQQILGELVDPLLESAVILVQSAAFFDGLPINLHRGFHLVGVILDKYLSHSIDPSFLYLSVRIYSSGSSPQWYIS